jgi:putative transposase
MRTLRRLDLRDRDYFITTTTFNRQRLLLHDEALVDDCLTILRPKAWVVMPDHIHAIVNSGNEGISRLLHRFKITYSRRFRDKHSRGRVWQNRFWDRLIRDQDEFNAYVEYIHYNPVKHQLVTDPYEFPHSSLWKWYLGGFVDADWGDTEPDVLDVFCGE